VKPLEYASIASLNVSLGKTQTKIHHPGDLNLEQNRRRIWTGNHCILSATYK